MRMHLFKQNPCMSNSQKSHLSAGLISLVCALISKSSVIKLQPQPSCGPVVRF